MMKEGEKKWLYTSTEELWNLIVSNKPELARMILIGLENHWEEESLIDQLLGGEFLLRFLGNDPPTSFPALKGATCRETASFHAGLREYVAIMVVKMVGHDSDKLSKVSLPVAKAVFDYFGGTQDGGVCLRGGMWRSHRYTFRDLWKAHLEELTDRFACVCYQACDWRTLAENRLWGAAPDVFKAIKEAHLPKLPLPTITEELVLQLRRNVLAHNLAYHECMYLLQAFEHDKGRRVLCAAGILLSN